MPDSDPEPLKATDLVFLEAEIKNLETLIPSFEPRDLTPSRSFQSAIQKNLEWAQHTLARFTISLSQFDQDADNKTRVVLAMSSLRYIVSTLMMYDRRIDDMRLEQGETVSLADIFRRTDDDWEKQKTTAKQLLDGPQPYTYYPPPAR